MRSTFAVILAGLGLIPGVAKADTVGSYFDANNQSGQTIIANGTPVSSGLDPDVAHFEDTDYVKPKIYTHIIEITAVGTNAVLCQITEQEKIQWFMGDTVDWLKATSSNNNLCQVTSSIDGEADQTSHVSIKIV